MVGQKGERARFIVLPGDGPPATLRMIRIIDGADSITDHELEWFGVSSSFARQSYVFRLLDGTEYRFDPLGCSCGAGRVAWINPAPGYELVRTRTPEWMSA